MKNEELIIKAATAGPLLSSARLQSRKAACHHVITPTELRNTSGLSQAMCEEGVRKREESLHARRQPVWSKEIGV